MNGKAGDGYAYMNKEQKLFSKGIQIIHRESGTTGAPLPHPLQTGAHSLP
jgi:hypothetical protein